MKIGRIERVIGQRDCGNNENLNYNSRIKSF